MQAAQLGLEPFQSALPMKGATGYLFLLRYQNSFQSALPMKGATYTYSKGDKSHKISIRAPNERSDELNALQYASGICISIRAPNERSDEKLPKRKENVKIFQSALPMKGATAVKCLNACYKEFQSALPMKGATVQQRQCIVW